MDIDVVQDRPPEGIEVVMVEAETVRQIRSLFALGWGCSRLFGPSKGNKARHSLAFGLSTVEMMPQPFFREARRFHAHAN